MYYNFKYYLLKMHFQLRKVLNYLKDLFLIKMK